MNKLSIRFYNDHEVRAVWDEVHSKWWFSVPDVVGAINLLAWVFIPILYVFGQAPEGDDVSKFLYNFCFDHPAYLVSICAIAVMVCCICLAVKKDLIENFRMVI